ncbi:MAG: DUF2157 domain-containing protein [Gemmatimonadetes bacterium]|nr:DUF2157 domain-containing protein [Gemmatimonadota bacterium]NIR77514.1 DUF2157 domain-containing protein [Gemmatimonadota bacterium]NIT86049.1 DUF2157 domain-containing protein [Gemmatimonadota bacterium]NIU29872.1 DUF2157 domain-containing protein [Gemmatimonadota bacterium]NIU34878.1 DUF2157 domain-containing protein [Gemmatimonadota bacterium]
MPSARDHVEKAIRRWREKGLVSPELAERLRSEAADAGRVEERRWSQYAVAGTGAAVLLVAGGTFFAWAWPALGPGARSILLGGVAVVAFVVGRAMEIRERWVPAAYMLQTAGLGLLLLSLAYSEETWDDATLGGVVSGAVALAAPMAALAHSLRRNAVMPAIEVAVAYPYLFLFLDRSTTLDIPAILWILDGVMVASIGVLALRIRSAGGDPGEEWALGAFVASLFSGLVLVFFTATESLGASGEDAVWALDAWLVAVVLLTVWAARTSGREAEVEHRVLGYAILLGVLFAFWTLAGALDVGVLVTALGVAAVGVAGLVYALPRQSRGPIMSSCLALLIAAWYYGVAESGALGAVGALVFTAILLFWISTRLGIGAEEPAL